jgi:hypothetical protein
MCHSRKRETIERRDESWPARHSDRRRDRKGDVEKDSRIGARVPNSARVGDRERDEVMQLLADAFADGRLTREEFDTRSAAALVARTGGDLAALTQDLAPGWLADRGRARLGAERAVRATERLRAETRSYVGVMLLLVTVWLVIGLSAQTWYPWFVWPALGWGISIVARLRRTTQRYASAA